MEEVVDAALLLQQVTYGVAVLASGKPPEEQSEEARPTLEFLFDRALEEVLQRRHKILRYPSNGLHCAMRMRGHAALSEPQDVKNTVRA